MRRVWLVVALGTPFLLPLLAQDKKPPYVQRVIEVKSVDVRQLADLITIDGGPRVKFNEHFRTISLFGEEQAVAETETLIKRFDLARPPSGVASRNIEAIVYLLIAAPKGTAGDALPADLDAVAKQLKTLFGYNDFRLLDSSILRTREGGDRAQASGTTSFFPTTAGAPVSTYSIHLGRTRITGSDRGNVVRMDDFRFNVRVPYQVAGMPANFQFSEIGFSTNLDIREGQKVVVGKAKYDGSDGALILVVTAKVTD